MTLTKDDPGSLHLPGSGAARCEASQPVSASSPANDSASPTGPLWRLCEALDAAALVVTLQTPAGAVNVTGATAKAVLALDDAGSAGLSPPQAMHWTAQLASPVRVLRRLKLRIKTVRGTRQSREPVRYVLHCQPQTVINVLKPRGGAR